MFQDVHYSINMYSDTIDNECNQHIVEIHYYTKILYITNISKLYNNIYMR